MSGVDENNPDKEQPPVDIVLADLRGSAAKPKYFFLGKMSDVDENLDKELVAILALARVDCYIHAEEEYIRRQIKKQKEQEIEPESIAFKRKICYEWRRTHCNLQVVCRRLYLETLKRKMWHVDEQIRMEMRKFSLLQRMSNLALRSATRPNFNELVESFDKHELDDVHKKKVEALMVYDPKRKACVPSRFCSFHLAGFDLDENSTAQLGPPYNRPLSSLGVRWTKYVTENAQYKLALYCTNVVSIRVTRVGPHYTYPVKVYGKVIARDEIDYKCVYLFDRERKDAQTIRSEEDMLALTGPYRALVTLAYMYFEFDLKIAVEDEPDKVVEFSKGVIPYFCKADRNRIILQLPSFLSTVKLVLQHMELPVAASLEVSVVGQGHSDPLVHFDGKTTAGTSKNYRQHMVLYDSSVPSSKGLLREDGSLVLNRNLVAINGNLRGPALEEDEKLVLYLCFLDAGCEIEDEDEVEPEDEDEDGKEEDDEEEVEEDHKHVVSLIYPLREAVWENGNPKLKVKVDWTAILDAPDVSDFFQRHGCLPDGYSIDYRLGIRFG